MWDSAHVLTELINNGPQQYPFELDIYIEENFADKRVSICNRAESSHHPSSLYKKFRKKWIVDVEHRTIRQKK